MPWPEFLFWFCGPAGVYLLADHAAGLAVWLTAGTLSDSYRTPVVENARGQVI